MRGCRLCLRKLGVIGVEDDRAVVARVFWKCVAALSLPLVRGGTALMKAQVHEGREGAPDDVLARASGFARRPRTRRLPLCRL